uniref:Ras-associating domain-containing protein n=1 Tax=Ailuropoda melanoleuca TaxID=9646 RepID=A0A7N5K0X4_AILME
MEIFLTMNGTIVSSKIRSATVRTLQELGACGDEKSPDYMMVVEPEARQVSSTKDLLHEGTTWFVIRCRGFPDVCSPDRHNGILSEEL